MTGQATWAIVIVVVVAAAQIGFFLGRANGNGVKQKVKELEESLERKDAELASYKREVDSHFDQTASLFVSMAGSYKALFEHLSSGYEKLSEGSSRDLFRERVATLLLDGPDKESGRIDSDWHEAEQETDVAAHDVPETRDDEARDEVEQAAAAQAEEPAGRVEPAEPSQDELRVAAEESAATAEEDVSPAEAEGPTGIGNEPAPVAEEPAQASGGTAGEEMTDQPGDEPRGEVREEETAEAGRRN